MFISFWISFFIYLLLIIFTLTEIFAFHSFLDQIIIWTKLQQFI